jgi:hypothetical protein
MKLSTLQQHSGANTSEIRNIDQVSMARAVYDNVLKHLLDRALNGEEKREEAGYFVINVSDDDHSQAYNHFRSLFGIEVDPDEKPIKPLNNRVLAAYGNFALIQQVQTIQNEVEPNEPPIAYGVSISVIGLCPERGGPLVVKSS